MEDPFKILRELQAAEFLHAYERCVERPERTLGNPAIVCAAFSAELGLKELLRQHKISFGKEHRLLKLFELLPRDDSSAIRAELAKDWPDLDQQLTDANNAFVAWRYFFESRDPITVNSKFLAAVAGTILKKVGGACLVV
jgi:hypothetical protein